MNARRAKQIRREAMAKAFEYYKTLVSEEESKELTKEMVLEYLPQVTYVMVETPASFEDEPKRIRTVSQYTQRWFIKQEKKKYEWMQRMF